jgi:hypothetical protein
MKIPKYWAKGTHEIRDSDGRPRSFTCWRWSDASVEDAREQARARAVEIARKFLSHERLDRYSYGERPLREEIIEAIRTREGKEIAVITRNAYGALVLNSPQVAFIDIDLPEEDSLKSFFRAVQRRFGRMVPSPEDTCLLGIAQWVQRNPGWCMRVYRTFGGFRCAVIDRVLDPTTESTLEVLRSLNSDPLYIRLCQRQECFRARLTPKPWRCGIAKPPSRFPYEGSEAEVECRKWETKYQLAASRYTTCKLVKQIGEGRMHPEADLVLSVHDRLSCLGEDRRLA